MKLVILTISTLLIALFCRATNHYVSSSTGFDTNPGTQANPWKSLYKVNAMFASFATGDSLLFKSGDTFRGSLFLTRSGVAGSPIVIASYGAGAKPVISGLFTLDTWVNIAGNIWQCTPDSVMKTNVNILTINGLPQAVGRTPWMVYQNVTGTGVNGTLSSTTLTGTPNYTGAEIIIKCNAFVAEKAIITSQTGSAVSYTTTGEQPINNNSNAPLQAGRSGYGFFIDRFANSLDQEGEWYFNKGINKMQLYTSGDPNTYLIKASYVDTVINMNTKTNITLNNLVIEGGGVYGVESYTATNISIKNCDFYNNTKAVYIWNCNGPTIIGCTFNHSFNGAIYINGSSGNPSTKQNVLNNTVNNTGQLIGNGIFNNEHSLRGIVAKSNELVTGNFINVIGNTVRNTGNGAIQFQGSNVLIRRNICDTFCNQLQDNGGIYTFVATGSLATLSYSNRLVDSNFVSNAIGSPQGEGGNVDVTGLYNDDQTMNVIYKDNTVWNVPGNGIQLNTPLNMLVHNNTVYNCDFGIALQRYKDGAGTGNRVTRNIIYQKSNTQLEWLHTNRDLSRAPAQTTTQSITNMAFIDSNWISNLKTTSYQAFTFATSSSPTPTTTNMTLAQWQTTYTHDQHSILQAILTTSNSTLYTNPSYTPLVVGFSGLRKMDPKGNIFDNGAIVPAYSSLILINDGTAPVSNIPPVARAGSDQTITLPVNSVNLSGTTSSDADGTISGYLWTKVSGPGTFAFGTASASTTTFNSLVQGDYTVDLQVTDNLGAVNHDQMQVHVLPALNIPPVARAGNDTTITLPASTATLSGVTSTDADGTITNYSWTKISGPASGTIVSQTAATTNVNSLTQGVYNFRLKVTDNAGDTSIDTKQVTVLPAIPPANIAPVARAGADSTIQLPVSTCHLIGSASSDADGTISTYSWTQSAGPGVATIGTASAANTTVSSLIQGVYTFRLKVVDNAGDSSVDNVNVTVLAANANIPPVANAGTDDNITIPVTSVNLNGSASTDSDDGIASYLWTQISGPSAGTIATPNAVTSTYSNLIVGVYLVKLKVTDNAGDSSIDTKQVTVNDTTVTVNTPPSIQVDYPVGGDTTITLPANSLTLTVTGIDADGTISTYAWIDQSGPGGSTIGSPATASTLISNLPQGVHVFRVTVTDNGGATAFRDITITVQAAGAAPVNILRGWIPIVN